MAHSSRRRVAIRVYPPGAPATLWKRGEEGEEVEERGREVEERGREVEERGREGGREGGRRREGGKGGKGKGGRREGGEIKVWRSGKKVKATHFPLKYAM